MVLQKAVLPGAEDEQEDREEDVFEEKQDDEAEEEAEEEPEVEPPPPAKAPSKAKRSKAKKTHEDEATQDSSRPRGVLSGFGLYTSPHC